MEKYGMFVDDWILLLVLMFDDVYKELFVYLCC